MEADVSTKSSKKRKRRTAKRRPNRGAGNPPIAFDANGIRLISMEITWEPLDDDSMKGVARADRERINELGEQILYGDGAAEHLGELEALIGRYPDLPKLRNFFNAALQAAGDHARLERMIREDAERFPDYLFAVAAYARLCLHDNRLDEAMRLFEGRMCLPDFHPNRKRFHITELMALHGVLVELFSRRGDLDQAAMHLEVVETYEPEHPETQRLRDVLALGRIRQASRKLLGMSGKSSRSKRAANPRSAQPATD